MKKEEIEQILELILLKVLCYKKDNGEYIIFAHDAMNTKRKVDEIMDIIKVALQHVSDVKKGQDEFEDYPVEILNPETKEYSCTIRGKYVRTKAHNKSQFLSFLDEIEKWADKRIIELDGNGGALGTPTIYVISELKNLKSYLVEARKEKGFWGFY